MKNIIITLFALFFFCFVSQSIKAQEDSKKPDTVGVGGVDWFAYPFVFYSPETDWGADGDDLSNELIGFEGRWWRKQPNPGNTNDADYLAHKNDPDYIYEGYLLFDYLVTNEYGYVVKEFEADNSFHVLWNMVINSRLSGHEGFTD